MPLKCSYYYGSFNIYAAQKVNIQLEVYLLVYYTFVSFLFSRLLKLTQLTLEGKYSFVA